MRKGFVVSLMWIAAACSRPSSSSSPVSNGMGGIPPNGSVYLASPEAFASDLPASTYVEVAIGKIASQSPDKMIAQLFSIQKRGAAGSVPWNASIEGTLLKLSAATPLDPADYSVRFAGLGSFPSWVTGFSIGSRPRIQWIKLVSKDGQTVRSVSWQFSEPVQSSTVYAAAAFSIDGSALDGRISDQGANAPVGRQYQFDFNTPVPLTSVIHVVFRPGILGASTVPFDPHAWDSPTVDAVNAFALDLHVDALASCDTYCWRWQPQVN